jgi:hypothetical protein
MYTWIQQQQSLSSTSSSSGGATGSSQPETKQQQPLMVFATGYEHTGKRTLAHHIAYTYRTQCDMVATSSSSTSVPLLLQLNGYDWRLQNYEMDIDDVEVTNRYRRRLYRKLVHVIESHYYNLQRRFMNHQPTAVEGSALPNMILITNIEDMDSILLLQLLSLLKPQQRDALDSMYQHIEIRDDTHDDDSTNHNDNGKIFGGLSTDIKLQQLCQNSIIYMTSNQYGVSVIARHWRQRGQINASTAATTTTTIEPTITLTSDIRDIVQRELNDNTLQLFKTIVILPFVPFTPVSLEQLLRHRITTYYTTMIRQMTVPSITGTDISHPSTLIITDTAIQEIIHERNVEYIEWRAKSKSSTTSTTTSTETVPPPTTTTTTTIFKIVVEGAHAIHDHHPVLVNIYTQLHQALEGLLGQPKPVAQRLPIPGRTGQKIVLDYDRTSTITLYDRGILQLCDTTTTMIETDETEIKTTTTSDSYMKEDWIGSLVPPTFTNHNCRILRRFPI